TQAVIEDNNIVGQRITLIVKTDVGASAGSLEILVNESLNLGTENYLDTTRWQPVTPTPTATTHLSSDGTVLIRRGDTVKTTSGSVYRRVSFNEDEKVALGAAERADVSFVTGPIINATVTFSGNTVTRTDCVTTSSTCGGWSGLSAGQTIDIAGNTANSSDGLAFYTIGTVGTDASNHAFFTVVLPSNTTLTGEAGRAVKVLPIAVDPLEFRLVGAGTSVSVTFANNGFDGIGRVGDTITRATGTWTGFATGSLVKVTGSSEAANNTTIASAYYT